MVLGINVLHSSETGHLTICNQTLIDTTLRREGALEVGASLSAVGAYRGQ